MFRALQLDKTSAEDPEKLLDIFTSVGALEGSGSGYLINDLEAPAFECQPLLAALKAEIQKQAKAVTGVMMSGSGEMTLNSPLPSFFPHRRLTDVVARRSLNVDLDMDAHAPSHLVDWGAVVGVSCDGSVLPTQALLCMPSPARGPRPLSM